MPSFLYFLPDRKPPLRPGDLDELGLGYAIDHRFAAPVRSGPGGRPGLIVGDSRGVDVSACRYVPDRQTWSPRRPLLPLPPGEGRGEGDSDVQIGYYTDHPPGPADLARDNQVPGRGLRLPDGHTWQIPVARYWSEFDDRLLWDTGLPRALRRNDAGVWVPGTVVAKYARLWDLVTGYLEAKDQALADAGDGDGIVRFTYPAINELAIAALACNYRIGPDELELLGLYTDEVRGGIIRILTDEETRERWIKKKLEALTDAGGDSSAGPGPETPAPTTATDQPSPNSTPGA